MGRGLWAMGFKRYACGGHYVLIGAYGALRCAWLSLGMFDKSLLARRRSRHKI